MRSVPGSVVHSSRKHAARKAARQSSSANIGHDAISGPEPEPARKELTVDDIVMEDPIPSDDPDFSDVSDVIIPPHKPVVEHVEWRQEPIVDFELPYSQQSYSVVAYVSGKRLEGRLVFQQLVNGEGYAFVDYDNRQALNTVKLRFPDEERRQNRYFMLHGQGKRLAPMMLVEDMWAPGQRRVACSRPWDFFQMNKYSPDSFYLRIMGEFDLDPFIKGLISPIAEPLGLYEQDFKRAFKITDDTFSRMDMGQKIIYTHKMIAWCKREEKKKATYNSSRI